MSKTKMKNLKNRWAYKIKARNATIGIWLKENKSFLISRWKFGQNYLFEEYHWATGAPFGTAWDIAEIEKCPIKDAGIVIKNRPVYKNERKLLDYLNKLSKVEE